MPYQNVTPGINAPYAGGGMYLLMGGTVSVDTRKGLLAIVDSTKNNYAHIASTGGTILIRLEEQSFYTYPGKYFYRVEIENSIPIKDVSIKYTLYGNKSSAEAIWDGKRTVITFKISDAAGNTVTVAVGMKQNPLNLKVNIPVSFPVDKSDGSITLVCYARGTSIETPSGERLIEDLRPGDEVITYKNMSGKPAPIKWVGMRHVKAFNETEKLVRVRKNALEPGIPNRDLLITPEHCLFIDDKLFPVRTLVNGRSIAISEETDFEVFHLELEEHSIIFANGARSESFLDTGNKHLMLSENARSLALGHSETACSISAAPVCTAPEQIKPVHDALAMRAAMQGYALPEAPPPITPYPDLHLVLDDHRKIRPARIKNGQYVFFIPNNIETLWIDSNTFIPSRSYGPWYDDRRKLGVLVGKITLFTNSGQIDYADHLTCPEKEGWHAIENKAHRWTDGYAKLDIGPDLPGERMIDAVMVISVEIVATGAYLALPTPSEHSLTQFPYPKGFQTREESSAAIASLVNLVIHQENQINITTTRHIVSE